MATIYYIKKNAAKIRMFRVAMNSRFMKYLVFKRKKKKIKKIFGILNFW